MKLKAPKLKIKLAAILWVIFLLIVAVELLVIYKYVYLSLRQEPEPLPPAAEPPSKIDEEALSELRAWLEAREDFELPRYELKQSEDLGRENPFLEYR